MAPTCHAIIFSVKGLIFIVKYSTNFLTYYLKNYVNNSEERSSNLLRGGSLKSRTIYLICMPQITLIPEIRLFYLENNKCR